uniref:Uncharacterized protein n=1 Tax=Brassica oleracea var. oleracea TaxID=109376 RepID=A0A0D3CFM1_BRAOL
MAPRRKSAAPTYAQLFCDGSGTSSSGPSSSDAVPDSQPSQRVAWSPPPPPQMSPPPPPALLIRICDLLAQPGREGLDVLDPGRPRGTYWFEANNRVSRSVSKTIKGYYGGAYLNWSKTPNHVKITLFKCFAQKWHWSLGITERVKAEFVAKAKTVSDWKDKWEIYGYEGKPTELTKDMWDGPIAYWEHPSSIKKANSCSASRRTKDKDGHLLMLHRTGQKPHAGIRLDARRREVLPFLSDLFKMTHATSDGVFVDPASEKLFHAVATRTKERETQLTQQSPDGLPVARKKKGRIVGIGSVNEVARATSSYTSKRDEETSQMKARMDSQQVRLDSLEDLLDVMVVGNPVMQRMLSERRTALGLNIKIKIK